MEDGARDLPHAAERPLRQLWACPGPPWGLWESPVPWCESVGARHTPQHFVSLSDASSTQAEVKGIYLWLSTVQSGARKRAWSLGDPPPLMIQLGVLIVLRHSRFVGPMRARSQPLGLRSCCDEAYPGRCFVARSPVPVECVGGGKLFGHSSRPQTSQLHDAAVARSWARQRPGTRFSSMARSTRPPCIGSH